jgi:hypothetical protein
VIARISLAQNTEEQARHSLSPIELARGQPMAGTKAPCGTSRALTSSRLSSMVSRSSRFWGVESRLDKEESHEN